MKVPRHHHIGTGFCDPADQVGESDPGAGGRAIIISAPGSAIRPIRSASQTLVRVAGPSSYRHRADVTIVKPFERGERGSYDVVPVLVEHADVTIVKPFERGERGSYDVVPVLVEHADVTIVKAMPAEWRWPV